MKIYNSKNAKLETFKSLEKGKVGIYYCGPTVHGDPHIGHLMSAVVFDILSRWFSYNGYKVTIVRNVTDIDDKILAKSTTEDSWWQLAYRNEQKFNKAYNLLNIQEVSYSPRATAHIGDVIDLISKLINKGHAYKVNGNVFFDIESWQNYGSLTKHKIKNLKKNKSNIDYKKNLLDFTLWKSNKLHEPHDSSWSSPWSKGRPGWHIECSAMATKYLGENFDIHGGGLDLRFPHHENENAQAQAAGMQYANLWMHHGMVYFKNRKLGKSNGNFFGMDNIFKMMDSNVIRYFLSTTHYRSNLDFSFDALKSSEISFKRIKKFINRGSHNVFFKNMLNNQENLPDKFINAMNDDLNTPKALSVIHETVRDGNLAFDANKNTHGCICVNQVLLMMEILGFNLKTIKQEDNNKNNNWVSFILKERSAARKNKDWIRADKLRLLLKNSSILLEDTPYGTTWYEDI